MRSTTKRRIGIAVTTLVLAAGCAGGRSTISNPVPEAGRIRAQTPSRGSIVAWEEIRSVEAGFTALQALRRLRPEFLSRHATPLPGDNEAGFAVVYLDGVRLGGLETLENIPVTTIVEMRYLRHSNAEVRMGKNHRGGVILVSTLR